ncbi:MAG: nicotinate-nucleotide--dimethylbenzimidazole phosphoribosyltransferase [Deltaproteobacteria bacterium]|nr:nicotinate-nucleotide--dimethylbenzimidazole phosphoribosyltransferase [Deltaproteobacteria bacterium]
MKLHLPALDPEAAGRSRVRDAQLTKPPGSLGLLESLPPLFAGLQGNDIPTARPAALFLFGADHPATKHGISPYPSAVTQAMMGNFVRGGAAAAVLAEHHRIPLTVVDVGVDGSPDFHSTRSGLTFVQSPHRRRPAGDIRHEDAQTPDDFGCSVEYARSLVLGAEGPLHLTLLGEMGIGNTTVAAAVGASLLGLDDPGQLVGRGTGADDAMLEAKRAVVRDACRRVSGEKDPLELLRRLGGRELASLAGAMLGALERGSAVLVDGFIVTTVALAVVRAFPAARSRLLFAHSGDEHGHRALLAALDARPLLALGLRLGEGSGALLAFALVEQALALHGRMATFAEAAVPDRER